MAYTDIEQRILDMWPKFEDGCYVQLGDKAVANSGENSGKEFTVRNIYFENRRGRLRSSTLDGCYWNWKAADPYVKRPEHKDSWERLEKDATMSPWSYCDKHGLVVDRSDGEFAPIGETFAIDLIRRAKALAEKEAER